MSYKCEILADSINQQGHRLTTFKITYPHIIHAEMLRHRMLSRNVASSRAIPFKKMVKDVQENPFIPIAWQKTHKGMQGTEYLSHKDDVYNNTHEWLAGRDYAVAVAKSLNDLGVTKQLCNRLLEPFVWTTELVSGTEWVNFFELRCPKYKSGDSPVFKSKKDCVNFINSQGNNIKVEDYDEIHWLKWNTSQAEIHIQKIAEMMLDAYNESKPKQLDAGEFHIPFGDRIDLISWLDIVNDDGHLDGDLDEQDRLFIIDKLKISTARCARLSYTTLGDNPKIDYKADIKLHDKLLKSKHLSCFEHCARAMSEEEYESFYKVEGVNKEHTGLNENKGWCNNYRGFINYRYLVENEL